MNKIIILIFTFLLLEGCAVGTTKLDIAHSDEAEFNGPIGDVDPVNFAPIELEDNRSDKVRIGWKKNGFGARTGGIVSNAPVTDLVSNAIAAGLKKNNHSVVEGGKVKVSGTVDNFWFEYDSNFATIEFIGDIQCTLTFTDVETGRELYKTKYAGSHSEKRAGGLKKRWQTVMSKTLDKLVESLVFDEDLSEALE